MSHDRNDWFIPCDFFKQKRILSMSSEEKTATSDLRNTTSYVGVRYRLSKKRKHGIRPDRYYIIRYKVQGILREEAAGWSSEGMTAEEASKLLGIIKNNIRHGIRPQSLAEMRQMEKEKREKEEQEAKLKAESRVPIQAFWEEVYYPEKQRYKKPSTMSSESYLYKKWILPVLGSCPIQELDEEQAAAVQLSAINAGRSASSTRFIMSILSQIWAYAAIKKLVKGDNPVLRIPPMREDNRRLRFLTRKEANKLLDALGKNLVDVHDIALMSLLTGMRAGEIFTLKWGKINFNQNYIHVTDTKTGLNRIAYIIPEVQKMLRLRWDGQKPDDLVFPGSYGQQRKEVPDSFFRAVNKLGLNDNIKDKKDKVVFHTLRHTFASWLVQNGEPLFTVAELMGHTTLEMTKRYSHLSPESFRNASMKLTGSICMETVLNGLSD